MWILGDWGQVQAWNRSTGVKMTKGEDGVYSGVLTLPKGTPFDIKIMESSVSGTSGGNNVWSAVRYTSVLNSDSAHDFGEFTNNLIPNGRFDEGQVGWTPSTAVKKNESANTPPNVLELAEGESVTSGVFTMPTNQVVQLTGYCTSKVGQGIVSVRLVTPQYETVYDVQTVSPSTGAWKPFRKTIRTGDTPVKLCVELASHKPGEPVLFDTLTIVSP